MDRVGGSLDHFLSKARALRKGTAYMGRVSNAATCVAGDSEIILIMTKGNSGFLLHTQQGSCSKSWKFTIEVVNVVNVKSVHISQSLSPLDFIPTCLAMGFGSVILRPSQLYMLFRKIRTVHMTCFCVKALFGPQ